MGLKIIIDKFLPDENSQVKGIIHEKAIVGLRFLGVSVVVVGRSEHRGVLEKHQRQNRKSSVHRGHLRIQR
jgi:hypothetical protein